MFGIGVQMFMVIKKKLAAFSESTLVLIAALAFAVVRCGVEYLPAGSLVMQGPSKPARAAETSSMNSATSFEYLLGLKIQSAMLTNDQNVIEQSFEMDGLFQRFIPTLPVSDEGKKQI